MFTSVRFIHLHVHCEWSRPRISFYSTETANQEYWGMFSLTLFSKRKKRSKGLNSVCIYRLCFWHVWGFVFLTFLNRLDLIICNDDCLQIYSREMVPKSPQPSSLITLLVCRSLFLENSLFYLFFFCVNFTPPRPDQTNVDSHIFVLMYVDDKIVKWTVINNVNMFFFWIKISTKLHPMSVHLWFFFIAMQLYKTDSNCQYHYGNVHTLLLQFIWAYKGPSLQSVTLVKWCGLSWGTT